MKKEKAEGTRSSRLFSPNKYASSSDTFLKTGTFLNLHSVSNLVTFHSEQQTIILA